MAVYLFEFEENGLTTDCVASEAASDDLAVEMGMRAAGDAIRDLILGPSESLALDLVVSDPGGRPICSMSFAALRQAN